MATASDAEHGDILIALDKLELGMEEIVMAIANVVGRIEGPDTMLGYQFLVPAISSIVLNVKRIAKLREKIGATEEYMLWLKQG